METEKVKSGGQPPSRKKETYTVHTAVLEGIAVFFYSTVFFLFENPFPLNYKKFLNGVSVLRRVRFFFVGKWKILPDKSDKSTLFSFCRGPPFRLSFSKKFRRNGGITGEVCTTKSIYYRGK